MVFLLSSHCHSRYNIRRKSALRPSHSFDTMKSTTSSVASDDNTLESSKDHLDLASSDFPPLGGDSSSSSQVSSSLVKTDEAPKWAAVTKSSSDHYSSTVNANCDPDHISSSSSSFSSSAVIDASDPPPPPPDVITVVARRGMQSTGNPQCTVAANTLPDIAAQAPNVMNTTNR